MTDNLPPHLKQKILEAAKNFCVKDISEPDVLFGHLEFNTVGLIPYQEGADFGYSLSLLEIQENEKDIALLKVKVEALNDVISQLKAAYGFKSSEASAFSDEIVRLTDSNERLEKICDQFVNVARQMVVKKRNSEFDHEFNKLHKLVEEHNKKNEVDSKSNKI